MVYPGVPDDLAVAVKFRLLAPRLLSESLRVISRSNAFAMILPRRLYLNVFLIEFSAIS